MINVGHYYLSGYTEPWALSVHCLQSLHLAYCQSAKLLSVKKSRKSVSKENEAAYLEALHSLKEREQGYVPYDMLLTSISRVKKMFPKRVGDGLLRMFGHEFFWKRVPGEPLLLYGVNRREKALKDRGPVEICRFRVPEQWVGAGIFLLDAVVEDKKRKLYTVLITLYLCSVNSDDFATVVADEGGGSAYLASIYLDDENSRLFYELAEERYVDIE
jgi:hypothetical protein